MSSRREFIQTLTAAGVGLSTVGPVKATQKPLVISTWNFGLAANAAAWKILNSGGRALDAVEAGGKVAEGDPTETSDGLGGLPERDGCVTMDARCMDETSN